MHFLGRGCRDLLAATVRTVFDPREVSDKLPALVVGRSSRLLAAISRSRSCWWVLYGAGRKSRLGLLLRRSKGRARGVGTRTRVDLSARQPVVVQGRKLR
jgi:hypothetical protein